MVLSTPCGKILESLIKDGVKVGVSSRALGQLVPMEGKEDTNVVKNMKLIAIDAVADPSYPKAFVNGILESKQYVLAEDGLKLISCEFAFHFDGIFSIIV